MPPTFWRREWYKQGRKARNNVVNSRNADWTSLVEKRSGKLGEFLMTAQEASVLSWAPLPDKSFLKTYLMIKLSYSGTFSGSLLPVGQCPILADLGPDSQLSHQGRPSNSSGQRERSFEKAEWGEEILWGKDLPQTYCSKKKKRLVERTSLCFIENEREGDSSWFLKLL